MLSIPKEFFLEENRCNFYISQIMKKSWAVQLTLLDEILEIANKHNIKIWVDYGTLLGAVRHHGFIPWDDDIDASVMRNDYVPLIHYLKEELPPYRIVSSFYTEKYHDRPSVVVSSRANIDIGNSPLESKITTLEYGFPCSSWVDIFAMDYIPSDPLKWERIRKYYSLAYNLAMYREAYIASGEFESLLSELESFTETKIKRDEVLVNSIWMLAEKIATMTKKEDACQVGWYGGALRNDDKKKRPLLAFSSIIYTDFEFTKVPIPSGYTDVLKAEYGEDYMTPIKNFSLHDYPHFKNQERSILAFNKIGQLGDIF
ncbi:lipopolysaccharide cholinephosphotransferase [Butyrivibrio fibrisolvens]|uniref:Lipopolysaccharide cholinephosphotransferase n=1 Tax=Butyrivibrio fibrisolvens TaxID=831 RepID=A0A1H9TV96_BUTFI|nr:LicD family protein [Butyrivibrio fibrisolvens]SES00918.1 lipopolysaccharide cholinephosphotransferase [Butyrivibrio fibrisolvens]